MAVAMDLINTSYTTIKQTVGFFSDHRNESYYQPPCSEEKWYYFFASSWACYGILYLILAIWTFIKRTIVRSRRIVAGAPNEHLERELPEQLFGTPRPTTVVTDWSIPFLHRLQQEANKIVCCQNWIGDIVACFAFCVAMTSFGIYIYDVADVVPALEVCRPWMNTMEWQIDFACNLFFLLYFILRLLASTRKVWFLSEMYTIVDYFTIPPAFVALMLDRNWSGLRFLRILHIFSISDVLQFTGILKSKNEVRLSQLVCRLAGVVFVGAGFFHLLENFSTVLATGHSYWKFLYFTIITISTVGYGDISPLTPMGRVFCCLFIMAALGLFASSIPDIASMIGARYRYGGKFKKEKGTHHIIVCGSISHRIASQILESCFHNDQEVQNLSLVFVSHEDPDMEMESLLSKNFTQVAYIQGDVLNSGDLERAAAGKAFACLIIADKKPERTDSEDALNIMRVISIKNVQPTTRVIVQLFHRHHQTYLFKLPTWRPYRGDTVINLSVIKMGLLAANCQAMGSSSLIANLLSCYSVGQHRRAKAHAGDDKVLGCIPRNQVCCPKDNYNSGVEEEDELLGLYKSGFKSRIRIQRLSDFYTGMGFHEAAAHCYGTLNILMIGLFDRPVFDRRSSLKHGEFIINPGARLKITPDHLGVFVSQSATAVDRAWYFCKECHAGAGNPSDIKRCNCQERAVDSSIATEVDPVWRFWMASQHDFHGETGAQLNNVDEKSNYSVMHRRSFPFMDNSVKDLRNSSNEPTPKFHQVPVRTFEEACILNTEADYRGLTNHIVVCILAEAGAPPLHLYEFIAPLRSSSLPYTNLKDIVLFGNGEFLEKEWESLAEFPRVHVVKGNAVACKNLDMVSINTCSVCVVLSSHYGSTTNEVTDDQQTILATLRIRAAEHGFLLTNVNEQKRDRASAYFNVITALDHDENIRFLDQEDPVGAGVISLSRSYIGGEVFVQSVLDSLTISTYFNPLAIPLIQSFMYGRSNFLQHDDPLDFGSSGEDHYSQSSLTLMELGKGVFSQHTGGGYRHVVLHALAHGLVVLGVFRQQPDFCDVEEPPRSATRSRRCVITAPSMDFILQADDLLFVFSARNPGLAKPVDFIRHDNNPYRPRLISVGQQLRDDVKEDLKHHQIVFQ